MFGINTLIASSIGMVLLVTAAVFIAVLLPFLLSAIVCTIIATTLGSVLFFGYRAATAKASFSRSLVRRLRDMISRLFNIGAGTPQSESIEPTVTTAADDIGEDDIRDSGRLLDSAPVAPEPETVPEENSDEELEEVGPSRPPRPESTDSYNENGYLSEDYNGTY